VATVFLTWTPTFLAEKFGFRLAAAGLSGALFIHLASALAVAPAGCVADWWARRRPGGRLYAQAAGLLAGAGWLVGIGSITNVGWLLTAMAAFGVCKGFYDAGIFASLYDVVPARSRATAAGLMNTVGWGLGSLGALLAGWYADHGPLGSPMANMSRFITGTSALYLGGGLLLAAAAAVLVPRDRAARSE
jgi:MFS family permease